MLGDTITITLGGTGGTDKVLNKINSGQDFSSTYLLREATQEFLATVSHSKNGKRDRHFVKVTQTIFATDPDEEDVIRDVSSVILARPFDTAADIEDLQQGLSLFVDTNAVDIINWQS
jgi:hypothetical protein